MPDRAAETRFPGPISALERQIYRIRNTNFTDSRNHKLGHLEFLG